jgi:WD40 repeat protein
VGTAAGTLAAVQPGRVVPWDQEHHARVSGLKLSADGSTLASTSHDRTLVVWSAGSGTPRARLELKVAAQNLALSSDGGRLLEQIGARQVRLWELPTEPQVLLEPWRGAGTAALSADGKRLAVYPEARHEAGDAAVYDLATGQRLASHRVRSPWNARQLASLSTDGSRLALVNEARAEALSLGPAGEVRVACTGGRDRHPVALSPSGAALVVVGQKEGGAAGLQRIELEGCKIAWSVPLAGVSLAFSADGGRLVVGGEAGSVHLLDAQNGKTVRSWTLSGYLYGVAITRDGRRIAAAGETGAWLLDVESGATTPLLDRTGMSWTVEFSADGMLLVASGPWLTVWEGTTGRTLLALPADRATNFAGFVGTGRALLSTGLTLRREEITEDAVTPPEEQLRSLLARYRLRLEGQRLSERPSH